ncbi:MAG: dephospho-CoA kinase [Deltaproteobacteria bacterium]|nr:dephospho-CoA kinase [Deltaproteobacteria bacterium]
MGFKGRVIGLTGNVSCGKSTVARFLSELGVPVIDADQIAREVTSRGAPALTELVSLFGDAILDDDGELDRRAVRKLVFSDPLKRQALESVLHPAIQARSFEITAKYFESGKPVVVYEAALIAEAGRASDFDGLLVVRCSPARQRERLLAREGGMPAELADQMIKAQMPQAEKAKLATWIIDNDGTPDELRAAVKRWHDENIARRG